ncbi:hypothetical protein BURK2_04390 [Burkholderiales bacterium]|nr:MAG: CPBP family intramembrane metalloprotease [Burkholderiales bacterium]CAG1011907.1 hypothetical protein BURK2_04390 [Burkholderiales bacterium]
MTQGFKDNGVLVDAFVVTAVCFGWFILLSLHAVSAGFPTRPFTNTSLLGILVTELTLATAALGYLYVRGHDLANLVPRPSRNGTLAGIGLLLAGYLASWVLTWPFPADAPSAQPVEEMLAEARISLLPVLGVSLVNGVYEEVFLLGHLQKTLEPWGASFALGSSLLVRVLYHLYQGPAGAVSVLGIGLVFGLFYMRTKQLWPLVFAHFLADVYGFAT